MVFSFAKIIPSSPPGRELDIDGIPVSLVFRRNPRARRFILKIGKRYREVILTLPNDGCESQALDFVVSQSHWIKSRIKSQPEIIRFAPGAQIPLRNVVHTINHHPGQRGTVWTLNSPADSREDEENTSLPAICVAGDERHLARRLHDWLKKQARNDLSRSVKTCSAKLDIRPGKITIRDQTTRWGSCSSSGGLSFSWRLIMAPSFVLEYVAAHEVAHLLEMNHGPQFWELVKNLEPEYHKAQKWLKQHGAGLHFYSK